MKLLNNSFKQNGSFLTNRFGSSDDLFMSLPIKKSNKGDDDPMPHSLKLESSLWVIIYESSNWATVKVAGTLAGCRATYGWP